MRQGRRTTEIRFLGTVVNAAREATNELVALPCPHRILESEDSLRENEHLQQQRSQQETRGRTSAFLRLFRKKKKSQAL